MKVYLSLSLFFFAIIIKVNAQSLEHEMRECVEVQIEEIKKNTKCEKPNGEINVSATGSFAPYNFSWSDGVSVISTSNKVKELKAGFYNVNIISTRNRRCYVKKRFFVHGIICNDIDSCPINMDANEVNLHSISLLENADRETYRLETSHSPDNNTMKIVYRTHINNEPSLGRTSIWDVVPKPTLMQESFFEKGKTYEFAVSFNFNERFDCTIISNSLQINQHAIVPIPDIEIRKTKVEDVFTISPQPTDGFLNIKLNANADINSIKLLTMAGKALKQFNVEDSFVTQNLDLSSLTSGIYLLKFSSSTQKYFRKIVID